MDVNINGGYEQPVTEMDTFPGHEYDNEQPATYMYREVTEMPPSVEYKGIVQPDQPEYFKIKEGIPEYEVVYDGIVSEAGEGEAKHKQDGSLEIQNGDQSVNDRSQSGQYDYIDDRFVRLDIENDNRDNDTRDTSCLMIRCFRKRKITLAVLITAILTTVTVATIMIFIIPQKLEQETVNVAQTTVRIQGNEQTTDHTGSDPTISGNISGGESYQTTVRTERGEQTTDQTQPEHTFQASLVIIGGWNTIYDHNLFTTYDTVQIYTVDEGHVTWNKYGTPAPYLWERAGTATHGGNIYIAGGQARNSAQ